MRDRQPCSQQLQYHAVYLSRPVQVLWYTCIGVPVVFCRNLVIDRLLVCAGADVRSCSRMLQYAQ